MPKPTCMVSELQHARKIDKNGGQEGGEGAGCGKTTYVDTFCFGVMTHAICTNDKCIAARIQ